MFTRFVANSEKMSQIRVFRGPAQIIAILHRGVIEIHYNTSKGGGASRFITILQWVGGSLGTPNLYYVIYGRPLTDLLLKTRDP